MSTQAAADDYRRDSAAILRSAVSLEWIDRLRLEVDQLMSDERHGRNMGREGEGRFHGDSFLRLRSPVLLAFLREGGLGEVAATIMGSGQIRSFMDQLLVKEPGALIQARQAKSSCAVFRPYDAVLEIAEGVAQMVVDHMFDAFRIIPAIDPGPVMRM